jgi:hypothetical protein
MAVESEGLCFDDYKKADDIPRSDGGLIRGMGVKKRINGL